VPAANLGNVDLDVSPKARTALFNSRGGFRQYYKGIPVFKNILVCTSMFHKFVRAFDDCRRSKLKRNRNSDDTGYVSEDIDNRTFTQLDKELQLPHAKETTRKRQSINSDGEAKKADKSSATNHDRKLVISKLSAPRVAPRTIIPKYTCNTCSTTFVSITFLKRHIKQHGGKCTALFSSCFTQIYRKNKNFVLAKLFF
jgi:hypothetical protein